MSETPDNQQPANDAPAAAPTLRPSKTKSRYDFGVVSMATRKSMQGNKRRDTKPEVKAAGWKVLVLWEHQLKKKQLEETRRTLYEFVRRESDPPYEDANL